MYLREIFQYLIWPGFIILSWLIIKNALAAYEKRFPEKEELAELSDDSLIK
jgi:hypothetical protein